MSKSESRVLLLENDHLEMATTDQDGFSSGYDSAQEVSDSESSPKPTEQPEQPYFSCDTGCDSDSEDESTEVMNYKSTNALCAHLKYIMSMPELCDVTFLVGPTKVPVYGVKAILGTRSRVLYNLILNKQHKIEAERSTFGRFRKSTSKSHVTIDVKKYEPDDFQMIIQFVHCGSVDIGTYNVAGLLCGACQFGLDDLKSACWDFIRRTLTSDPGQSFVMMSAACRYSDQHKAARKLILKINRSLQTVEHKPVENNLFDFGNQKESKVPQISRKMTTV